MRILVADDSATMRGFLQQVLESSGYEVILAEDGLEAITRFYEEPTDLVLLDLKMPRLSGWIVCRILKEDPVSARTPVLVLTGMQGAEDRYWAEHSGADGYLTKDAVGDELVNRVRSMLAGRALADLSSASAPVQQRGATELLVRVCELFDRRLFEATIVNDIMTAGIRSAELESTLDHTLSSLHRLVGFDIGGIGLLRDRKLAVRLESPVGQADVEAFKARAVRSLAKLAGVALTPDDVTITVLGGEGEPDGGGQEAEWESVYVAPLQARGQLFASITLASSSKGFFEEQTHRNLLAVVPAIAAVVDSARRFRDAVAEEARLSLASLGD